MNPQAATLRLAVFPRSGFSSTLCSWSPEPASSRSPPRSRSRSASRRSRSRGRRSPSCSSAPRWGRCSERPACSCTSASAWSAPRLFRRRQRLGDRQRRHGRLPRRLHRRRGPDRLARAAPVGSPLQLGGRGDALRERRHLPLRPPLARARRSDLDLEGTLEAGLYPFVIGDLVKLYLAGMLLPGAWKLVKRLRG